MMNTPKSATAGELAPNYIIQWKSKVTDKRGEGTMRFFKSDAIKQIGILNYKFPKLEHWVLLT